MVLATSNFEFNPLMYPPSVSQVWNMVGSVLSYIKSVIWKKQTLIEGEKTSQQTFTLSELLGSDHLRFK